MILQRKKHYLRFKACLVFFLASCILASGNNASALRGIDFTKMSIEELMDIKVTSVSKKAQSLSSSAAAVFVITNQDMKRSGVTNIPDALRMVPGVHVASIDSNKWAVTCRGFNGRFADKLLVLIDGRQVYTPTFSGVYWEVKDVMLDDIDRIEVIRGPGATLWGANAVNGVINIISKSADKTLGGLVNIGGGTHERSFAEGRYGMAISENTSMRVYGKYFDRDEYEFTTGDNAGDKWDMLRSGFQLNSLVGNEDKFSLHGDIYTGDIDQTFDLPSLSAPYLNTAEDSGNVSGGNLTGRWERTLGENSSFSIQAYYDYTKREEALEHETRDSFNLDFQHRFALGGRHDIVWGLRYYYTTDDFTLHETINLEPPSRSDDLYSAFLQDEIMLIPKKLWLTLGSKFEHNNYSGYEIQPSARLLWSPRPEHKIWAAISRAVKTPSRADSDISIIVSVIPPATAQNNPSPYPLAITFSGSPDYDSEEMMAYELGYRFLPVPSLSLDFAAYYNDYNDLRDVEYDSMDTSNLPAYLELPARFVNKNSGHTYGAELAASWQALKQSKLHLAYSFHYNEIDNSSPKHQISLRSETNITANLDLDVWLRYVDKVTVVSLNYDVDDYITLDVRLAWRPADNLELSLVGQNLLDSHNVQYVHDGFARPTEIERSAYGKITYYF